MIAGIGVDIVNISRIKDAIERWGKGFLDRVFTQEEQHYSEQFTNPYKHYAARFAAKEAFIKAFSNNGIWFNEITVSNNRTGKPELYVSERIKQMLKEEEITEILVSMSHEKEYAVAQVILVRGRD
ncbi:MAG: holo-ACP synthase [Nitrospirota bacterium]